MCFGGNTGATHRRWNFCESLPKPFIKRMNRVSEINSIPIPTNPRFQDLTGQVFTRLTVVGYAGKRGYHHHRWLCLCECGTSKEVQGPHLVSGSIRSCGCLQRDSRVTHGGHRSPEYEVWHGMWQRCTNPNSAGYELYKHRCPPDAWRDFQIFLEDMGPRPGMEFSIDRIDNNKGYGPENCRWATDKVQCNNTKRNVLLTHEGLTLNLTQWSERIGINFRTLRGRLLAGWSVDRVLTEPVH